MLPLTIELRRSTGPDDLERLQAREQVAEDRLELDPRDVRAHAEVLAEAEREVRVRAAIDPERERIVEHLLVAVRRREVERDLLAGADRHAAHLAVLGGGAGEVADRADPAQDLLDRVGQQLGIAPAASPTRPRCSENASRPPLIALRVVSLPASTRSSQYETSCSSVSGAPSISPRISSLTRSSCGSCAALRRSGAGSTRAPRRAPA